MFVELYIPTVSESTTRGVVSAWHKRSGKYVNEGETIFTLETDKVSTEIVAEKAGLLETKVPEGQEVKIGEVVATIDDSKSPPAGKKATPEKSVAAASAERGGPASTTPATTLSPAVRRIVEEEHLVPEKIAA